VSAPDRPAVDRLARTPCAWCGGAVEGRRPRFCSQACRQRDCELRTAAARYGADLATGRIAAEPAERVIERTVLAKHPSWPAEWVAALAEPAEQLRTGRIGPAHNERIRVALHTVQEALEVADQLARQRRPQPAAARIPALDSAVLAVLASLREVPGRTAIERLAALTGHDTDIVRGVLVALHAASARARGRPRRGGSADQPRPGWPH
jgi:hypothetical protein